MKTSVLGCCVLSQPGYGAFDLNKGIQDFENAVRGFSSCCVSLEASEAIPVPDCHCQCGNTGPLLPALLSQVLAIIQSAGGSLLEMERTARYRGVWKESVHLHPCSACAAANVRHSSQVGLAYIGPLWSSCERQGFLQGSSSVWLG